MKSRIPAIARKEFLHIVRDWRTLGMAFALPVIMILLFGYAITFDIKNLRLAVADEDHTSVSRAFIERFTASEYFDGVAYPTTAAALPDLIEDGTAQIGLAIPRGFATALEKGEGQKVQVLIDGAESNTATIAHSFVDTVVAAFNLDQITDTAARNGLPLRGFPPIDVAVRAWFNPRLDSVAMIVPGLIAIIIIMMSALLTSLTVVRERENGSLEGLFATPVRRGEILVGKMLPYLAIAMLDTAIVAACGVVIFDVPFAGSVVAFFVTALVFTLTGLSIGLAASVMSGNQMLANQIVFLVTMLPSFLISGFMFPIQSMPHWVQVITYIVPARYFVSIARGIMLKAQPASDLVASTALLLLVGLFFFARANLSFKKKL